MRGLICGGGVGGLSTAIALQKAGHEVVVFEKSDEMRVTGSGINLWPNAVGALYELGMKDSFSRISSKLSYYLSVDSNGKVLHERNIRDWKTKYGAPAVGVHRLDLTEMLAQYTGPKNIRYGHELVRYEDNGSQIVCHFSNGKTYEGDFLIGADGIHSQVRQTMLGKIDYYPNPHRSYRWRGMVSLSDVDFHPEAETEVFEGDNFFGSMPIGNGKGYWYASGPGLNDRESFNQYFQSWVNTHVPKTILATPEDTIFKTKLMDLGKAPERWVDGKVALLGDAAHPMMPDMAQGASQTFVDSMVLGQCLEGATRQTVYQSLREYENRRRPTAEHVVNLSRRFVKLKSHQSGYSIDPLVVRYERDVEGFKTS